MAGQDILEKVCVPRAVGSQGHERVRNLIIRVLEENGYEVKVQEFEAARSVESLLGISGVVSAIISLAGLYSLYTGTAFLLGAAMLSMALLLVASFILAGSERFRIWFSSVGHGKKCANIVGVKEGPGAGIAFCAHYDSKSQRFGILVRVALLFISYGSASIAALWYFAALIWTLPVWPLYAILGVSALSSLALPGATHENRSPGANDNGLAVAAMLSASSEMPGGKHYLVFTDAEEMGLLGASHLCRSGILATDVPVINMDIPFDRSGRLGINTGFLVPRVRSDRRLIELVKNAASKLDIEARELFVPIGAAADHMVFYGHGHRVVSLTNAVGTVHSPEDTVESLPEGALGNLKDIILGIASGYHSG